MGFQVLDSETRKYKDKKGWDCEVSIKGQRCKLEFKYDELSEITNNVCIELNSLYQSVSPIWVYGFPNGSRIDCFSMYLKDLTPYAESYPIKRMVGEFQTPAALIPKDTFLAQSFVKKFRTIETQARENKLQV